MLRRPDAGTFEHLLTTVPVLTTGLWRMSTRPSTEPYFAKRGKNRFDDPRGLTGTARFGVLYAAQDPETAFCESVIHESALFQHGAFQVPSPALAARHLTAFAHPSKTLLELVDLTGAALKKLGLNNDISSGDDYQIPQAWAAALHGAAPGADGIRYVSRQHNHAFCYAVFDRSGLVANGAVPLSNADIASLCAKFNIRAALPGVTP